MARAEPIRAARGCYWCGHVGYVEPLRFALSALCRAPAAVNACGSRCVDGLAGWSDGLINDAEREGLRARPNAEAPRGR